MVEAKHLDDHKMSEQDLKDVMMDKICCLIIFQLSPKFKPPEYGRCAKHLDDPKMSEQDL